MADKRTRALRRRLSRHEGGRGKRYPVGLRADVGAWVREQRALGRSWSATASAIGMSVETIRRWALPKEAVPSRPRRAVPVEVTLESIAVRVVSPTGYRVEGLRLDEVATLLRELS